MRKRSEVETWKKYINGLADDLNPQERWEWWVERKVKMKAFKEKQLILINLKRSREAEKYG